MTTGLEIKTDGPIFDKIKTDSIVNEARRATIRELIEKGEQRLDKMLKPRPGGVYLSIQQAGKGKASTGNYRRRVQGNVTSAGAWTVGKIHDSGVVYGPWLEGTSARNQTTRFKGYAQFRKTKDWLEKTQMKPTLKKHAAYFERRLHHGI